jgi:LPXTG-site transpeptidase (sortase) family protein
LSIPKLDINKSRVVGLGLVAGSNQLDDPDNVNDTGWYSSSAKPGQAATGKMAGLYDGHNTGVNTKGVFYNLGKLAVGDQIIIERGDGQIFTYQVQENQMPALEDIDMNKMMQPVQSGVECLNIITCGGEWDAARQTYTHRVTIRAVLI